MSQFLVHIHAQTHTPFIITRQTPSLLSIVSRNIIGCLFTSSTNTDIMFLIKTIPDKFMEPVGINILQFIQFLLSCRYQLWQIRIISMIFIIIICTISVTGSFYILQTTFQFQLFYRIHHRNSPTATSSYTHIQSIGNHCLSANSTLGSYFQYPISSFYTI